MISKSDQINGLMTLAKGLDRMNLELAAEEVRRAAATIEAKPDLRTRAALAVFPVAAKWAVHASDEEFLLAARQIGAPDSFSRSDMAAAISETFADALVARLGEGE